ncbi:uncharacterized protein LOC125837660 [Solanum verrucosum]|uniref:uncharacterized protein LOC125837660 n=1 Tax=Solanum verrucosum TaxID=315347 RepID=UPI0020D089C8|nr:uncharacterized protein LOC125837660 [Solanum verrucosum]
MVTDMRSRMYIFVARLSHLSSKKGKAAMLIGDMDIARLMIHAQQVEEDKLRDREEFRNKKAKTSGNEFGQQKKCPKNRQGSGNRGNRDQSSTVAQPDRAAPRGATSGFGEGANRLYAITSRQ